MLVLPLRANSTSMIGVISGKIVKRVLTSGHGGCTFTTSQTRTGAIPEAGGEQTPTGQGSNPSLSAFCFAARFSPLMSELPATARRSPDSGSAIDRRSPAPQTLAVGRFFDRW